MVRNNEFREDLFYRLNVIPLHLPSLKDREEGVLLCSEYIIKKLCLKMNKSPKRISKDVETMFMGYGWPGNVRELENVLEYAINFSFDDEITAENLPEYFLANYAKKDNDEYINIESPEIDNLKSLGDITKEYEKKLIRKLISKYGNTTETKRKIAEKLGMSITTLYRKLNDY